MMYFVTSCGLYGLRTSTKPSVKRFTNHVEKNAGMSMCMPVCKNHRLRKFLLVTGVVVVAENVKNHLGFGLLML